MHKFIALWGVFALFGCQPPVKEEPDAGTPVADAGVIEPDAGLQCPDRSHEADGGCVTELEWVQLAAGPSPRDHHGTYIYAHDGGATLVVVNGIDMSEGLAKWDAWSAALDENGFIASWREIQRPPLWAAGSGVDGWGDRIYVVSGQTIGSNGGINTPRVQSLQMNADGTPGNWREEKPLSGDGRFHITATRVGRWLFAMGGRTMTGKAMPEVWSAHIEDDGTLSDWSDARPFPAPRTHHASFAFGNRLYVMGGFNAETFTNDTSEYPDTLVATVDQTTGALSEWTSVPLPFEQSTHSAAVWDGAVYAVGGFDGDLNMLATVRRAPLKDDGTFGEWEEMASLPKARAHVHHTPVHAGRFYSVGGNIGSHFTQDVVLMGNLY